MVGVSAPAPSNRIGIVTVSFRSGEAVASLARSISGATRLAHDFVVVDNVPGGDDSLAPALARTTARVVARPDNPGYGGGINAGAATLSADVTHILVVNPDVVLDAGSLDELVRVMDGDSGIGSVGPRIRDRRGTTYPSARAIPSLRVGIGHALLGDVLPANPWTRRYHQTASYDKQRDAGWLSGACVLVRREAFEAIGGFDDDFFMYFEDVDLGFRLGQAGWRSVFVPTATVEHEGGHSTRNHSAMMVRAHHDSAARWIRKRYAGISWWPVRTVVLLGLAVRRLVTTRGR